MFGQLIQQFENLSPFREEPGKVPAIVSLRNSIFDAVFYDTFVLTNDEKSKLTSQLFNYDEGGMLYVYPGDEELPIEYFDLSHDLIAAHPELDTVTIPGVGSSVLGTASLARQVANVVKRPAVGIIAGYGAADVMSEALGGWFEFGTRNRVRSLLAEWKRQVSSQPREVGLAQREKYKIKSTTFLVDEPESNTLLNILMRHDDQLQLLVGHSKGALNIQNALFAFMDEAERPPESAVYENLAIVTFGCGVSLPPKFKNVQQYLGSWDMLGIFNTPPEEHRDPSLHSIEHRGHNLCSWNAIHMPIEELLP